MSDYRQHAACAVDGIVVDLFFPVGRADSPLVQDQIDAAKAICARCPVTTECLAEAFEFGDIYSVRGGLAPDERRTRKRGLGVPV